MVCLRLPQILQLILHRQRVRQLLPPHFRVPRQLQPHQAPRNLTPELCLARVKEMEPMVMGLRKECESAIRTLIPDPSATEQTLPPLDKVIEDKDAANFKAYGGLSEAFLYLSDKDREKGDKLFARFRANSDTVLGADDPYVALVGGDVGLFYFFEKDYGKAEPLFLDAIRRLEAHLTAKNSNNLVSNYLCMALIRDKEGKEAEAASYSKKLVDLVVKQQDTKMEAPTDTAKSDGSP